MRRLRLAGLTPAALTIIVVVVLMVVAGSVRARLTSAERASQQGPVSNQSPQASDTPKTEVTGVERIRVTSYGFEPTEIQRPKGAFFLLFDHLTPLPEVTLRLDNETGNKVREVGLKQFGQKRRQAELVDLPPGRYVLTEASHPKWVCHITITPK